MKTCIQRTFMVITFVIIGFIIVLPTLISSAWHWNLSPFSCYESLAETIAIMYQGDNTVSR